MKTIHVYRRVPRPHGILHKILDQRNLKAFHGPQTEISPWDDNCTRKIRFDVDASGSPLSLGSFVKANVTQQYTAHTIKNSVTILNLVEIHSTWTVTKESCLSTRADIHVYLPPPIRWIAENFVAKRAEKQIHDYITLVQ